MAKVTITVEDRDGGMVNVNVECDPPINRKQGTAAQHTAMKMLSAGVPKSAKHKARR